MSSLWSLSPGALGLGKLARIRNQVSFNLAMGHKIIERTRANGGHSASLVTGKSPHEGFMVAQKEGGHVIPAEHFFGPQGHQILSHYVGSHAEHFSHPTAHLGTWHDHESGNVFLDVAHNIHDPREAAEMGRQHDQISIYDLKRHEEVPTGGTGGLEKSAVADGCGTCGLPTTKVSATMEFLRRGGRPAEEE
jgi:hypothetical protein